MNDVNVAVIAAEMELLAKNMSEATGINCIAVRVQSVDTPECAIEKGKTRNFTHFHSFTVEGFDDVFVIEGREENGLYKFQVTSARTDYHVWPKVLGTCHAFDNEPTDDDYSEIRTLATQFVVGIGADRYNKKVNEVLSQ